MKLFFVKVGVFAFAVFAVISLFRLQLKINVLEEEYNEKLQQNEALEDEVDKLENQLSGINTEEHIVDVAKDKLNLRLPEEIIFYNDLYN